LAIQKGGEMGFLKFKRERKSESENLTFLLQTLQQDVGEA